MQNKIFFLPDSFGSSLSINFSLASSTNYFVLAISWMHSNTAPLMADN